MIKKTITYNNFLGLEVTETLHFNLNAMEQAEFEAKYLSPSALVGLTCHDKETGEVKEITTLVDYTQAIVEAKEYMKVCDFLKDLVLRSYGERSDAVHFNKNPEITERFKCSIAYAEMFELLFNNPEEMTKFASGVIYKKTQAQAVLAGA